MSGKILIVDDERTIRMALRDTLTREGHLAVTASNAEEAIRRCKSEPFDLLITDLKMPGMTGLEFIRHVRSICPSIRTILITAYGSAESAIEALRMGVSDYMIKPFRLSELRMTAGRLLSEADAAPVQYGSGAPSAGMPAGESFRYFFNLGKDNSIVLTGTPATPGEGQWRTAHDAVRIASRALAQYAMKSGVEFDPASAAEAISDVLYFERLGPIVLNCTGTHGSSRVCATIGLASPEPGPGQGSGMVCRQPAAGTFPGLRAAMDANGIAGSASSTSAVMPESRTEFIPVPLPSAYTITLDSSNLDLKSLVEGIGRATVAAGLNNERANEVVAAVNEAVLNSIEHGYGAGKPGKVEVTCRIANGELVTTVRDHGKGFDPPATPDGGGFTTLKRLMDRVAVESAPGGGTAVHLAKLLE